MMLAIPDVLVVIQIPYPLHYHIHRVGEHLQRIALKPSIHESSHNNTLYTFVRGITISMHTLRFSPELNTLLPRTQLGSHLSRKPRGIHIYALRFSPEPNTQSCPQGSQESPCKPAWLRETPYATILSSLRILVQSGLGAQLGRASPMVVRSHPHVWYSNYSGVSAVNTGSQSR